MSKQILHFIKTSTQKQISQEFSKILQREEDLINKNRLLENMNNWYIQDFDRVQQENMALQDKIESLVEVIRILGSNSIIQEFTKNQQSFRMQVAESNQKRSDYV